jgi:hypothetical protein
MGDNDSPVANAALVKPAMTILMFFHRDLDTSRSSLKVARVTFARALKPDFTEAEHALSLIHLGSVEVDGVMHSE